MLKNIHNVLLSQCRSYAKSKLQIKWARPERVKCSNPVKSGELEGSKRIPSNNFGFFHRQTEGIKDADENVKKLSSVGHLGREDTKMIMRWQMMDRVKRHAYDHTSKEVNIANLTARIRILQDRLTEHPHDFRSMSICKQLVDKRHKFLSYMRRWDYKRYEWLLEKLNIVFKAYPLFYDKVGRGKSLVKLTDMHCDDIRAKKLVQYKEDLLKERDGLLKEFGIDPKDRQPYRPNWCPSDTAAQLAEFKEVPDPKCIKET